jgi:hypothetical protein
MNLVDLYVVYDDEGTWMEIYSDEWLAKEFAALYGYEVAHKIADVEDL